MYLYDMTKVWWVNQRNEIGKQIPTNVVWSPHSKKGEKGSEWHWETMWDVVPGDIIVHYSHQSIVAISTALTKAHPSPNPYDAKSNPWEADGKRIEVEVDELEVPIPKSEIPLSARQQAYLNHGPFQRSVGKESNKAISSQFRMNFGKR
ncbi:hypothetical protein OZX74_03760 [Bifidobacterium sp. ESL0798]|uniref:hypothetical protein n=1 Tax=Bifidobacterium sp. ESL0798 TaxID=2983235 RepID=UPI0023F6ED7E|nr:hypothetical protein [Bifidobacterium sp. ESL0798]WEV74643.1 hypothetical protein OZX74_03760 [Bifidobacterium sp. ESL0798]